MQSSPAKVSAVRHFTIEVHRNPERLVATSPAKSQIRSVCFGPASARKTLRDVLRSSAMLRYRASRHANRGTKLLSALSVCAILISLGAPALAADSSGARAVALREQAVAYEHGEGVPRDTAQALALYCEAARLGDARAQFNLGWMYANGRGVVRDDALAAYFFRAAAAQGDEHARDMLRRVGDPVSQTPECLRQRMHAKSDAESDFVATSPGQKKVVELVKKLAPEYRISPRLALAVIRAESNFDAQAQSPKNAQGLMQLIPETSARFNVKRPFDPTQNIRGGLAYLRWLLAYFKGDVTLVLAAYNAGEKAVDRYRGIPPYAETRSYVGRVRKMFQDDEHPFDSRIVDPSPELPRMRKLAATNGGS